MESLHDTHTICNKEQMMLSLALSEALDELDKAREEGDKKGEMILNVAINMILEQIEPIEE
tara:strand:+ start:311 stop:493 length:183 start_codon:yes stop_codon:yes gene_type:complete